MRDYYHANKEKFNNPSERAKRAMRNRARRKLTKELGKAALKGKDVDHKRPLKSGGGNGIKNLRAILPSTNRARK